ncbi:MAG: agmatine/peptidylarginine deiminase [Vicinamibacterales bacterium]
MSQGPGQAAGAAAGRSRRPRVLAGTPAEHGYAFPAEWAPHAATWLSWPRPEGISFPGFYHRSIADVVRVVQAIAAFEPVRINVPNANYERIVRETLRAGGVRMARVGFHHVPTNECWARDHGPAFVQRRRRGRLETAVVDWGFNAWGGKYPPWDADDAVPARVAARLGLPVFHAELVMEGGAIDVNGEGTLLTTTSCLLNRNRNPGRTKAEIEHGLKAYYGQRHVVWLGEGIAGDDTDGHVDDLARFIDARTIVTAVEPDPRDENHRVLADNRRRLDRARDANGGSFTVVELPMPRPVVHEGLRLPATYVNFLFVNGGLLVPTFGDRLRDRRALDVLQRALPRRRVVGVDCRALIWGLGAIHCLTQQQPRG